MEHFFQNIESENWFDFSDIYRMAVKRFPSDSHFVEIGTWKGKSSCFMAVEIINSGKTINFDCVDSWSHPEISLNSLEISTDTGSAYDVFLNNISPVRNLINVIKENSWEAANKYNDECLDFVFLDARHDYLSVRRDLQSWFPKVKKGGIMAGHDYYIHMGVFPAVHEYFQNKQNVQQQNNCWVVEKQ